MNSRTLISAVLFVAFAAAGVLQAEPALSSVAPTTSIENKDTAPASVFGQEQLLAALSAQLTDHFHLEGDLQLELLRPWTPPAAARASTELVIEEYPSAILSSLILHIKLQNGAQPIGDYTILAHGRLLRDAWVARDPISRGALFDSAQLDTRKVDTFRERDILPVTEGNRDLTYVRSVQPGRVLSWHDVSRRPLVRKGEVIEVAAIDGTLTITMKALALESGAAGETVKVRNLVSQKDFSGLVVADSRVRISF